jgi:hypothetical protein
MITKNFYFISLYCDYDNSKKQSVAISDDEGVADGSAILEVKSTTKGFLAPRMTLAQRDVIVSQYQAYRSGALIVVLQALCIFYTGSESTGITSEQVTAIEITLKK